MSAKLSVNVNKVATVRNSRGGSVPSVLQAVDVCIERGRARASRCTRAPTSATSAPTTCARSRRTSPRGATAWSSTSRAIRGPDFLALVLAGAAAPVHAGAGAGRRDHQPGRLVARVALRRAAAGDRRPAGGRRPREPVRRRRAGTDPVGGRQRRRSRGAVHRAVRPRLRAGRAGRPGVVRPTTPQAAELAASLGLGVNAGHDLDLDNLRLFRTLPHLDEVSIGHALISHALFVGLDRAVRDYLTALGGQPRLGSRSVFRLPCRRVGLKADG